MPTWTYDNPPETITIDSNGDITITDGATSTTYSKNGSRTVKKNKPGETPSVDQGVATPKKSGDTFVTYEDKNPIGTTTVKFRKNGDVDIEVTSGKKHKKIHVDGKTGVRDTWTWEDPNPEPTTPKTDNPKSPPPAPPAPPAPPPAPPPPAPPPAPPAPAPAPPPAPPAPKKPRKKVQKPKKKPARKRKAPKKKRAPKKGKRR